MTLTVEPGAGYRRAVRGEPKTEREQLVADHLGFVRAIATRVLEGLPKEVELDDLCAYGTAGLLEAAERFDPKRGASFATFAYYRIRGAMYDGLRAMSWFPRAIKRRARFEARAAAYLSNQAERARRATAAPVEETVRELADALGGIAAIYVASFDEELGPADPRPPVDERLDARKVVSALRGAVEALPEKERRLLQLYYFEDRTLEQAGASLGLSKSWASRIHARAIDRLRDELTRDKARPPP